ncbi:MAG: hypothetical protein RL216_1021 [Pseudomonadota bacterium]|jgi:uncharacterized membrane protein YhaH (DUF805 family)
MNMIDAVKAVFSKYATFEGRARRSEYWWFVLFNLIVSIILEAAFGGGHGMGEGGMMMGGNLVSTLWSLATLLPAIAVGARRLHDIDRTGWWLLLWFIPLIGWIALIVFFASRGTAGPNRFGNDPLQSA